MSISTKTIITKILTEELKPSNYLNGLEVYKAFMHSPHLDKYTKRNIWQILPVKRTYFGRDTLDELYHLAHADPSEDEIDNLNKLIALFSFASRAYEYPTYSEEIEYGTDKPLVYITYLLAEIFDTEEEMWRYMLKLVECGLIADWLLFCEIKY